MERETTTQPRINGHNSQQQPFGQSFSSNPPGELATHPPLSAHSSFERYNTVEKHEAPEGLSISQPSSLIDRVRSIVFIRPRDFRLHHSQVLANPFQSSRPSSPSMQGSRPSRLALDARTAELKEKLLRSRSQNQNRSHLVPPLTATVAAKPSLGTSSSGAPSPAPSTTPGVPQKPAEASIQADANDIAALIASIASSSPNEIPGLSSNTTTPSDAHNKQAQQSVAAIGRPSLPGEQNAPMAVVPHEKQEKKLDAVVKTPVKPPSKSRECSPEEGECRDTPRKGDCPLKLEQTTLETAAVSRAENQPEAAAAPNRRQSSPKLSGQHLTKQNVKKQVPRENGDKAGSAASQPATQTPSVDGQRGQLKAAKDYSRSVLDSISLDEAFTNLTSRHPDLRDWLEMTDYYNEEARTRRLERFRKAKVLAAQKLKIEEEERKLMEEEALEMGLQRSTVARLTTNSAVPTQAASLQPSPSPPFPHVCHCGRTFMREEDLTVHVSREHSALVQKSGPKTEPAAPYDSKDPKAPPTPAKRSHEEDGDPGRKEKRLRPAEDPSRSRSEDADNEVRGEDRREPRQASESNKASPRPPPARDSSPFRRSILHPPPPPRREYRRSPPTQPRDYSPPRQPHPGPRYRDYLDAGNHSMTYDSFRRDVPQRRDSSLPIHIDLGRKGETRYFIVKSFNEDNVRKCMEDVGVAPLDRAHQMRIGLRVCMCPPAAETIQEPLDHPSTERADPQRGVCPVQKRDPLLLRQP